MKEPLFSPELEAYLEAHTSPEPALLAQLNRETHAKVLSPRMLSGHLQGRFLAMVSAMVQPRYILEIGTYTGYSALCLAEGLQTEGELHTIEINPERAKMIRKYFDLSSFKNQIKLYLGDAKEIIPSLELTFDLVFIDADKKNNLTYYELALQRLRKGGFLLIDNVLWSGKVLLDLPKNDPKTKEILYLNQYIQQDNRVENVLLPLRDGLLLVRKK